MRSISFTDFIKRALPFFAALVIGVFVASFFVDLGKPRFGRGGRGRECHKAYTLRLENVELKNENLRLRNELENHRLSVRRSGEEWNIDLKQLELTVPPPPTAK